MATLPDGKSIRCILNLYYEPVESTRRLVEDNRDWFIPMHGGRSVPAFLDDWMSKNLIGDDTGDNISRLNPKVNENSSIYWVWKHYDSKEVGNPDWIGFNHYRRYFRKEKIVDLLDKDHPDFIVSSSIKFPVTVLSQYAHFHYVEDMYKLESVIPKSDVRPFQKYLSQNTMYAPAYLFFMRKESFFEWCDYVFPIMLDLVNLIDTSGRNLYNKRAVCFLVERLLGFHIVKQIEAHGKTVIATPAVFDEGAKSNEIIQRELHTIN